MNIELSKLSSRLGTNSLDRSLFFLKLDAIFSQSMGLLISSIFITPLLLSHGAALLFIGFFSVIIYLSSLAQLLSLQLLYKFNKPKTICVLSSLLARLTLLSLGLLLVIYMSLSPVFILTTFLLFYVLSNISSMAFSYWMYYLVPSDIRGRFFASRMRIALIVANMVALSLTLYLQFIPVNNSLQLYNYFPLISSIIGLFGLFFLYRVDNVKSANIARLSLRTVRNLLKISTMRRHTRSIFLLYFAISAVLPFYTYYLLVRLGLDMLSIVALNTLSQILLILFVKEWGNLIDRFGVKPVLRLNAYLYILTFLIWPFTTLPGRYFLSIPLLIIIFSLIGVTTGGLNLSANLISYKLLRKEDSAYGIMVNNVFISLGSLLGSIFGTILSEPLSYMELSLVFTIKLQKVNHYFLIDISGLDFLFIIAAIIGFISLKQFRRYRVIDEEDEEKKYVELIVGLRRYINNYRGLVTVLIENGVKRIERTIYSARKIRINEKSRNRGSLRNDLWK